MTDPTGAAPLAMGPVAGRLERRHSVGRTSAAACRCGSFLSCPVDP